MESVGKPLVFLGEDDIKQAAVSFLKTHYKYRPRSGETKVQIDMRGEGGIVADGVLRFPKEDGRFFTATVEATARETKDEVFYRIQNTLLAWDAIAFSFMITTVMIVWTHFEGMYAIHTDGIFWRFFSMMICIATSFLLYQLLFKRRFRYHYIYAVEQFKRYHADEQWIAIGQDVFAPDEEKYKKELRAQCVFNGFGLIIIHPDRTARLLASPARQQVFGLNRKMIDFIQLDDLRTKFRESGYTNWLERFNGKLKNWIRPKFGEVLRFKRNYYHQQILVLFSIGIIAGMLYLEWTKRPVVYVDEPSYVEEMKEKQKKLKEESGVVIIDAPVVPFHKDFELADLLGENKNQADLDIPRKGEIIITTNRGRDMIYYDCERFYQSDSDHFLLILKLSDDLSSALDEIEQLGRRNLSGGAIWEGCFSSSQNYYIFVDEMMSDSLIAASRAKMYEERFNLILSVKKIEPAYINQNN